VGLAPLWRTLLGVHLFGAVINYSSIIIIADRLSLRRPLSQLQAIVLSRGFSAAANWSPFFAAMGVALTHAPGAHLLTLSTVGIPVALAALLFSGWALTRHAQISEFHGYPMHFEALRLPLLLALAVLGINALWPHLAILTVVTLLAISVTALLLLPKGSHGLRQFGQHIANGLPQMRGELVLFLAAGVFATGISAVLAAHNLAPQLNSFGPGSAWLLLLGMVALSAIGVHPVISIATVSGILMPVVDDPNLLGITFLMTWALGVTYSPLSGMHLAMQGRYGINAFGFLRWNAGYVTFMLLVDGGALFAYSALT
jgi:C4-dicarboxylate transporter